MRAARDVFEHDAAASLARWHAARGVSLQRRFVARADDCGEGFAGEVDLGCHKCGEVYSHPIACGLRHWCQGCSRRYRTTTRKRLARGLGAAHRAARAQWNRAGRPKGMRPDVTLVTLTARHSGDVGEDRAKIYEGWRKLQKRLWHVDGGASAPYVLAWEMTEGGDGLGHVHAHVACVWPWRDLRALDEAWQDVTNGDGLTVDVVGEIAAERHARSRGRMRSASVQNAASYLTAYVDAGGMSDSVPEGLAAAWLGSMRQKRTWHTSRGLETQREPTEWTPCCGSTSFYVGFRRGCTKEGGCASAHETRAGPSPPS